MDNTKKEPRNVHRPAPCPDYDVEGMESWLADMAQKGLLLAKDGFFGGIATFTPAPPQAVRYRLEAAPKSASMFADDLGEPDPEAVELSEKYHWTYVTRRGNFYIYRSAEPGARELNTDPHVQALAISTVRKRQIVAVLPLCIWLALLAGLLLWGGLLLTMISMRTWFFLLVACLFLWGLADSLAEVITLGKLQKKLRWGGALETSKNWKKRTILHYGKNAAQILLLIACACIFLHNWSVSTLGEDRISLTDYPEPPPFATIADFAGEGAYDYRMTMSGMEFNTVKEWSDWLAPRNIQWDEHAVVTRADGTVLEGGLSIDYHEAANPQIAQRLALEYYRQDRMEKGFESLEIPELNADYAVAYSNSLHFPTVVIRKGSLVIHATFYQTASDDTMELTQWAGILADSISQ